MKDNDKLKDNENPVGFIIFKWLDHKHSSKIIIGTLIVICLVSVLSDFIYHRYGHFAVEEFPGFYAGYGFVMFSLIILGASILRFFLKRSEDYYGYKAVDSEVTGSKEHGDDR